MSASQLPDFDALWDYNQPAETAVRFREILSQAEAGADTGYTLELLTQIARTEGLQGNFEAAHMILNEVEDRLTPAHTIPRLRYLLERGRSYNSAGEPDTAVPLFQEAYDLGLALGPEADFYTVDAAHMLAIALPKKDEQMAWHLKALDLARRSENERAQGWRGSLLNNLGWTYFDQNAYPEALACFEEALTWRRERQPDKKQAMRIAEWCVARVLRALGRTAEALQRQEALLAAIEAAGADQDGFVFEEVGECLLVLDRADEAVQYFARAYRLLCQLSWFGQAYPERLARLQQLGQVTDG